MAIYVSLECVFVTECFTFFRIYSMLHANVPRVQHLVTEEHAASVVEIWLMKVKKIRSSNMLGKSIVPLRPFIIHNCLQVAYHLYLPSQTRLARVTTVRLAKELMFRINMVTHLRKRVPSTVSHE